MNIIRTHRSALLRLQRPVFRAAFFVALITALYMALDPAPIATPSLDSYGDKLEHMLAFTTLTVTARLGWTKAPNWLLLERLSFIGALIEVFQAIPELHRDCDWHDWVADTLAIMATLGAMIIFGKLFAKLMGLPGAPEWPGLPGLRPVARSNG